MTFSARWTSTCTWDGVIFRCTGSMISPFDAYDSRLTLFILPKCGKIVDIWKLSWLLYLDALNLEVHSGNLCLLSGHPTSPISSIQHLVSVDCWGLSISISLFSVISWFVSIVPLNPPPSFSFTLLTFAVRNIHMPHAELSVHYILLSLFFHFLYFSSSFQSSQSPSSLSPMLVSAFLWYVAPGPDSSPVRGLSRRLMRRSDTQ